MDKELMDFVESGALGGVACCLQIAREVTLGADAAGMLARSVLRIVNDFPEAEARAARDLMLEGF